jgi:hypothetical protein
MGKELDAVVALGVLGLYPSPRVIAVNLLDPIMSPKVAE